MQQEAAEQITGSRAQILNSSKLKAQP
jgi:hypothetical protein